MHGQAGVRQSTRQRVLEVIDDLGYVPDGAAQSMARQRKEVIGLVTAENPDGDVEQEGLLFVEQIFRGVELVLSRLEWSALRARPLPVPGIGPLRAPGPAVAALARPPGHAGIRSSRFLLLGRARSRGSRTRGGAIHASGSRPSRSRSPTAHTRTRNTSGHVPPPVSQETANGTRRRDGPQPTRKGNSHG
jgi:hypothetical protein